VPFALVLLLLEITLIYHASRTGRLQPWAFIILMISALGALAYIAVELIPEIKLAGRTTEAKVVFTELLIQMKRAPRHVRSAQAEWLSIAERQLSG
jgi:hypothetical protein